MTAMRGPGAWASLGIAWRHVLVLLTAEGTRLRKALQRELYRPPPELLALSAAELEALLAATEKLRARGPGRDRA